MKRKYVGLKRRLAIQFAESYAEFVRKEEKQYSKEVVVWLEEQIPLLLDAYDESITPVESVKNKKHPTGTCMECNKEISNDDCCTNICNSCRNSIT
jgi:hypothetical protein